MAYIESGTLNFDDTVIGTDGDDEIYSYGIRSSVDGGAGDDTIHTAGYLSTVSGRDGDDSIYIYRSYIIADGGEGSNRFIVAPSYQDDNISNVTMRGGSGEDGFFFFPGAYYIRSSVIENFTADDYVVISIGRYSGPYYYDSDGNLIEQDINENAYYLHYMRNTAGDLMFFNYNGRQTDLTYYDPSAYRDDEATAAAMAESSNTDVVFKLKGITHISEISDAVIGYNDYYGERLYAQTLGEALPVQNIVSGFSKIDDWAVIDSDFAGDFRLDKMNELRSSSMYMMYHIDAIDDTAVGRMLAGNEYTNWIYAGDYGNKMWGGEAGNDVLIGGGGSDTFFGGQGAGNYTRIYKCSSDDLVVLWNVTAGDLAEMPTVTETESNGVPTEVMSVTMNDGSSVSIWRESANSTTNILLADGSKFVYDPNVEGNWQFAGSIDASEVPSPVAPDDGAPDGVVFHEDTAYLTSSYIGDFRLEDLDNDSITNISAPNDTVSGRILVGDGRDNVIRANDYGSSIWGGSSGDDSIYGGAGTDTFVAGSGEGYTCILGYGTDDEVYFHNFNFSDLRSLATYFGTSNRCAVIVTNDGTYIDVWSPRSIAIKNFRFADGSMMRYVTADNAWQRYNESEDSWQTFTEVNGMPVGIEVWDDTAYIYSDFVGDFRLEDLDNDSITNISAANTNDNVIGRVLIGDDQNNVIYANDYGSSIWGGSSGDDSIYGGAGTDTFVAGRDEGTVYIGDVSDDDIVYLHNISYSDISDGDVDLRASSEAVAVTINGAESPIAMAIKTEDATTTNIRFSDGLTVQHVYAEEGSEEAGTWLTLWPGLSKSNGTVYVSAEFDGDIWLSGVDWEGNDRSGWSDKTAINIDATDNPIGGRMLAGNALDNVLRAGTGGSTLWGGNGGNDELHGGKGNDTFIAGQGEGNLDIWDCEDNDLVYLWNINLEDISDLSLWNGSSYRSLDVTTNDGTKIEIWSDKESVTTTAVQLADNSRWRYNHSEGVWSSV